jgi:ATP-binding cassette subfamily B protein
MKTSIDAWAWDVAHLGEAMELIARKARLLPRAAPSSAPPGGLATADPAALAQSVHLIAGQLGIEAEPVEFAYAEADRFVRRVAPAILLLPPGAADGNPRFLALLKSRNGRATLLAPDFTARRVSTDSLRTSLCAPLEAERRATLGELLDRASIPPAQREQVTARILTEQLSAARLEAGWLLRLSPAAGVWQHARHARLVQPLLAILGGDLIRQVLLVITWFIIGRSVLSGNFDPAWLWAWALLLFTGIPLQLLAARAQGQLATGLSGVFKARLLYGALKLQPDEIRHQGLGQFLGRVLESNAIELLALSGGLTTLMSLTQLLIAIGVLATGIGGWLHALLLVLCALITLLLGWRYWRTSRAWVAAYRGMTNDLVERMVGHRTRLAQEDAATWHEEEDRDLDRYLRLSENVDRVAAWLAAIPRAWMVGGLAGLATALLTTDPTPARLAISLGGIFLALQALNSIIAGVQNVVAVTQAWDQVAPLFNAAARREEIASIVLPAQSRPARELAQPALLTAKEITFRYRQHGQPVLDRCSLQVRQGERLLLEGPSGGGKSSLAAVLAGLRSPESGLLLLQGYDQPSLGAETWRRRVAVAPQFHENHVFTETFAFNLLMGRRWPPTPTDLAEAEAICGELGLGDLIGRMPSGLQQMVGESGWQLSHGERSRLYIARALLQGADLMILDESFAALDPQTLTVALQCVLRRAPTLMVIAHP